MTAMSTATSSRLPAAPARVGVQAGWWISDTRDRTSSAHRVTTSVITGRASSQTLCGRALPHLRALTDNATGRHACRGCWLKASRAIDPDAPRTEHTAPPPTVRRIPAATSGPQDNTVAARVARRAAFRTQFDLSDRAQDYIPQPYGESPDPGIDRQT